MKVIAIDLDGTLLSEELIIHEKDISTIIQAKQQGYIVAIATGRALFDTENILNRYRLSCPIIASNGAQICIEREKIHEQFIDQRIIEPMIQWLNQEQIYYQIYLPDKIMVSNRGILHLENQLHDMVSHDPGFNKDAFWESVQAQIYQYGLQKVNGTIQPGNYDSIMKLIVVSPDIGRLRITKEYFNQLEGCMVSSSRTGWGINVTKTIDEGTAFALAFIWGGPIGVGTVIVVLCLGFLIGWFDQLLPKVGLTRSLNEEGSFE